MAGHPSVADENRLNLKYMRYEFVSVAGCGVLGWCEIDTCCLKRERRGRFGDVELLVGWLGK